MYLDVTDLRDFYAAPPGRMVTRHLAPAIGAMMRVDAASRVLGFGFATPFLDGIAGAERVLAFMPAGQGVLAWPADRAGAAALVDESALPLPDASIDCLLLVHALEVSPRPQTLMSEARRVLTRDGRLIVAAPNRKGAWARSDLSPFGFGRPYSRGQLRQLFAETGFQPTAWTSALHMPPVLPGVLLGAAGVLDRVGRRVWPAFAGIIVVSAVKHSVSGIAARARPILAPYLRPALRRPAGLAGYRRDRRKIA